ncbi:hypothetical protein SCHPADRAFT_930807 [Schizopora paradoxa]|uniref:Uncharacterized protein n=1 Tax=Schizopora paradoxa TaxID=27342 RepID=A0A0H2RDV8_9AGAM|nr:hypothetical protein SCHPADRAFT_930807 [Schizopora paradoxa]
MFPNVEKLQIGLEDYKQSIPFDIVLDATPRVRDLTLDLPHCVAPTQYHGQGTYYYYRIPPCRDLETIRFKNCDSLPARWTLYFLEKLKGAGGESKFVDIKRIEIEGCNRFKGFKDDFVNVVGDKLVWNA